MDKLKIYNTKLLHSAPACEAKVKRGAISAARIGFTEINREYIYQLKDELDLSLSKVVNMLITESRNR